MTSAVLQATERETEGPGADCLAQNDEVMRSCSRVLQTRDKKRSLDS